MVDARMKMKSFDLGKFVKTLANVGVIAGIVFLAFELRQNNELMEAEARFNRVTVSTEAYNITSTNGELAEIRVKAKNNESLTEVEHYRFESSEMRMLINMEWIFRELPVDSPERKYAERIMMSAMSHKLRRQIFLDRVDQFDASFVSWVEDNFLAP
jgi:hypothetical protein